MNLVVAALLLATALAAAICLFRVDDGHARVALSVIIAAEVLAAVCSLVGA